MTKKYNHRYGQARPKAKVKRRRVRRAPRAVKEWHPRPLKKRKVRRSKKTKRQAEGGCQARTSASITPMKPAAWWIKGSKRP